MSDSHNSRLTKKLRSYRFFVRIVLLCSMPRDLIFTAGALEQAAVLLNAWGIGVVAQKGVLPGRNVP